MKLSGRNVPFWAFRPMTTKGRTLFGIYRIVEATAKGVKADKRIGSLYYGLTTVNDTKDEFSYSTFAKKFKDISELSNEYKKKLLETILERL